MAVAMLVAGVLLIVGGDPAPKGEERLRGNWTAVACEVAPDAPDDVKAVADRIRKTIKAGKALARFQEGKFTLALWDRAEEMSGKTRYDGSRKPERVALVTGWREHPQTPCIVRVEGDTLTLAWRHSHLFEFPDGFDPAGKSDVVQVKFERKK